MSVSGKVIDMRNKKLIILTAIISLAVLVSGCSGVPELQAPGVTLSVDPAGEPAQVSSGVQLLVMLTVLTLAPSVLILATSFTRIVIVFSFLRNAIGAPTIPPNQVILGLSLVMTIFIMSPTLEQIDQNALQPYLNGQIEQQEAFDLAVEPVREFMFANTNAKDLELFLGMNDQTRPETLEDISTAVLMPSFVISELRTAFTMGFMVYVPFLIIDMVISSVLLSMGMMMLPPSLISMPFKLLLFVMVDGWYLITKSLMFSFS